MATIKNLVPKLSIVIINYNGLKFLPRLFKSIFSQTEKNIEVIMIDNASTDTSIKYIKKNYPKTCLPAGRVKIVKTQNLGYGHGCNTGAKNAKGEYVLILNPDIYLPKDFIKQILKYNQEIIINNTDKKIGATNYQEAQFDKKFNPKNIFTSTEIDLFGNPYSKNTHNPNNITLIPNGACFLINRKLLLKTKGFNKNIFLYGEEVEYFWRLKILGYENFACPNIYYHHYGSGITGKMNAKKMSYMIYGSFIACYTNYSNLTLLFILPIYLLYFLTILISILFLTKFNFNYCKELLLLIPHFFTNLSSINKVRKYTQKHRKLNDLKLLKHISIIPSIIRRLSFTQFFVPLV